MHRHLVLALLVTPALLAGCSASGNSSRSAAATGGNAATGELVIVLIDGKAVASTDVHPTDGSGRALNAWPGGRVPPGEVFLLSSYAGSYDSRYFGPVPVEGLLGRAIPVSDTVGCAITVGDNTTLLNGRVLSGAAVTLRNNQITK